MSLILAANGIEIFILWWMMLEVIRLRSAIELAAITKK